MQYIHEDVLKLFFYMLFQTRSNNDHYRASIADETCEDATDAMNSFNYFIRRTIENNDLGDLFKMPEEKKQNDSYFVSVFLKDKSKLLLFIKKYIDEFRKDNLGKGCLIYKKQLEFMEKELTEKYNFYQTFYDTNIFDTTLKLKTAENLPDEIAMGLRPVEFIIFLILYKETYIKLDEIEIFSSNRIFDISLGLEFLKTADELFKELYLELEEDSVDEGICQSEKIEAQLEVIQNEIKIFNVDGFLFNPNNKKFHKNGDEIKFKSINSKNFKLAEFVIKNPDKVHKIKDFYNDILKTEYFDFDFHCFKRIVFDLNNKLGFEEKTSPFISILGQTEFILNTSKVLSSNITET